MKQKEIDAYLANTKVYVNGKSKEIQEKLFSLGYSWNEDSTGTVVCHTEAPFLFIYEDKAITRSSDMDLFCSHENSEITAEEIIALEITEPTYRPFKTNEECLAEMMKHKPFGLVKYYDLFISIISMDDYGVEYLYEKEPVNLDYSESLRYLKFIDGAPFGIKKE